MDAALHVRARADGHVAVDRLDAAADIGVDQADRAVHGLHATAHAAAAIHVDPAIHGLEAAFDAGTLAEADAAVDGRHVAGGHVVAGLDAAVDGLDILGARAALQVDAAVDGAEVAVGLAGLRGDAAVDLVDVAAGRGRIVGEGEAAGGDQGQAEQGAVHAGLRWVLQAVMQGAPAWFTAPR